MRLKRKIFKPPELSKCKVSLMTITMMAEEFDEDFEEDWQELDEEEREDEDPFENDKE